MLSCIYSSQTHRTSSSLTTDNNLKQIHWGYICKCQHWQQRQQHREGESLSLARAILTRHAVQTTGKARTTTTFFSICAKWHLQQTSKIWSGWFAINQTKQKCQLTFIFAETWLICFIVVSVRIHNFVVVQNMCRRDGKTCRYCRYICAIFFELC